jgi:hypothetical protein
MTSVNPVTTWSAVTIVPSLDHTTPLPSPVVVLIVTTDGESFATRLGMPVTEGVTVAALMVDPVECVGLAQPAIASAATTTTMNHPAIRRAFMS